MSSFNDQDIARSFDMRDRARGQAYQVQGHVLDVQRSEDGSRLTALVQGTRPAPYRVDIEITTRRDGRRAIQSYCSCPVGYMCKHGAAALYEALAQDIRRHERLGAFAPTSSGRAEGVSARALRWVEALRKEGDVSRGEPQGGNRMVYVLSWSDEGSHEGVRITPFIQYKLQNGIWSAKKAVGFGQASAMRHASQAFPESDRALFRLMKDNGGTIGGRTTWSLGMDGAYADFVIARVLETGRAFSDEMLTQPLILGAEEEGVLSWRLSPDRKQTPTVVPRSSEVGTTVFLPNPWYKNDRSGTMGRLRCSQGARLLEQFLKAPPIAHNEVAGLRKALAGTGVEGLPAPFKIREMKTALEKPAPRLTLGRDSSGEEAAFLSFFYGHDDGAEVQPQPLDESHYALIKDDEIRLYRRNVLAEAEATKALARYGLKPDVAAPTRVFKADLEAMPWFWLAFRHKACARLESEEGISVAEALGVSSAPIVLEPDSEEIEASFTQNGAWWFSMDLGILVGGERIPLLPVLLAMIRAMRDPSDVDRMTRDASCYAPLPDGRMIALPAPRVRAILKTLIELFDDNALDSEGKLRVPMDLTAAFLKLEAITAKRWLGAGGLRRLVEKLNDFGGIKSYALPKGFKATLRPYQVEGYNWLRFLGDYGLSGILADDMGLGKTVQALAYLQALKEAKKLSAPCLIVMPTSLIANWQAEAERFAPSLRVLTLHGKERVPRFDKTHRYDVVLTTYPLLPRDGEKLAKTAWSLILLDEAQAIKNPAAKMTQAVCALQAEQRLCLTGTPIENHLGEAWSLFTFLMPGLLGDHKAFAKHYRNPIEKEGDEERKALFARRLRPFVLRRLKAEVEKDLPPKTEIVRHVSLGDDQRDLYETVRHVMSEKVREEIAAKGMARSHIVILDALLKLRQTCCDPRLVKLEAAKKVKSSAKLEELRNMLPTLIEDGRRILLFSQFTSMLDLIKKEVESLAIPFVELRGTTKDRVTPVRRFQGEEVPLFLISLKAGGTGLNLTAADTVIHYDPWWNPSVENQATDRAHRIGQTRHVFVYKMIAKGTVEERIVDLQARKAGLAAALFGDRPAAAAALTPEDIRWLMDG